jgi:hypothetical protein
VALPAVRDRRVVLITGAAAGIGLATAHAFAAKGHVVALTDRDADAVFTAAQSLGDPHAGFEMNVTDDAAVTQVFDEVLARFGRIDVLVNNAAIIDAAAQSLFDIPTATIRELLSVNVEGAYRVARVAAAAMIARDGGAIVNLSSGAALIGSANRAAYATSKAAIIGLTRALAREFAGADVRVNAVLPGYVATEMLQSVRRGEATDLARVLSKVPLGRLGEPAEIAAAVLHLAESRSINGALLVVDGGTTVHGGAGVASVAPAPIRVAGPGRVVVVMGGASRIGTALADRFVAGGDCVAIIDRDAAAIAGRCADRLCLTADCLDEAALRQAFTGVAKHLGPVAVLVNTIEPYAPSRRVAERPPTDFASDIECGLLGTMLSSRLVASEMLRYGGGAIVNVLAGVERHDATQACIESGVLSLTRNLACEWAGGGVRVNMVSSASLRGANESESNGLDGLAATVAFLASSDASYITGADLACEGVAAGETIA